MAVALLVGIVTGVVGYLVGAAKAFRQKKIDAYESVVEPFIRASYPERGTNRRKALRGLNTALYRMWLFAGRRAALAGDRVATALVHGPEQKLTRALQDFLSKARQDVQPWPWSWLSWVGPSEIVHFRFKTSAVPDEGPLEPTTQAQTNAHSPKEVP